MEMTVIQELQDKIIDQQYAIEVSFIYPPSQHLRGRAGLSGRSVLSESLKCESLQKKKERPTESSQKSCASVSPTWIKSQKGGVGGLKINTFPPTVTKSLRLDNFSKSQLD